MHNEIIIPIKIKNSHRIIKVAIKQFLDNLDPPKNRILIIAPNFTLINSVGGEITQILYSFLKDNSIIDIIPASGMHQPLSKENRIKNYGKIPEQVFKIHNWRDSVKNIGQISSEDIKELSNDVLDYTIDVDINQNLLNKEYDHIISIGQVYPHETAGFSNGVKNILYGLGGSDFINKTHFLSAVVGIDNIIGQTQNPIQNLFKYASDSFLKERVKIHYISYVISTNINAESFLQGLFFGDAENYSRIFSKASKLSYNNNINVISDPLKNILVFLDPQNYSSTWRGNEAIYRTRRALENNGNLVIIAPGLTNFIEDPTLDDLIRKFGYLGKEAILEKVNKSKLLQENLSLAAHLIQGSSENKFKITYCTKNLSENDFRTVNYNWMNLEGAIKYYQIKKLKRGLNILPDGNEIFYITNPSINLWIARKKFS